MKHVLLISSCALLAACMSDSDAGSDGGPDDAGAAADEGSGGRDADDGDKPDGQDGRGDDVLDAPPSEEDPKEPAGADEAAFGDSLAPLDAIRPQAPGRRRPIHIMDISLADDVAILATASGAYAVDVSDPASLAQVGDNIGRGLYWTVAAEDGVYVAGRGDGVRRAKIERRRGWSEDARHAADWFTPEGIAVAGETVFVAAQEQGLLLLDRLDLQPIGGWDGAPNAIDVVVNAGVAYIGDRVRGVVIADVSDTGAIKELGAISLDGGLVQHLALSDDGAHLYVAAGAVLSVVDVTNPLAPTIVAERWPGGVATAVAVDGDLLALANWADTRVYDLSDPTKPRLVGVEDAQDASMSVAIRGDLLMVGDWDLLRTYRIDTGLAAPEIVIPRTLTVFAEGGIAEVYAVIGNDTDGDQPLDVFDVTCASPAVTPVETEARVAPGLVAAMELKVDVDAAGGGREFQTRCTFWSTDPDESAANVEIVVNPQGLAVGDEAPDWTLPDLEGELYSLSAQRGKVVLLTIFSSL